MRRRYLDAIALVQKYGKPDLFITMTCNPDWVEIQEELKQGQVPQDRPDLTARIFRAKLHDLKDQLFKKGILGKVAAHVHVVEFQKRGLPHAHILIIMHKDFKITNADVFDKFVCAEIPDFNEDPVLYEKVMKHMMHGPCGDLNKLNACMRNGVCKSRYPRSFIENTMQGKDSYPIYRRRNTGIQVKAVKYLYKYVYKGHDRVAVSISHGNGEYLLDEIKQYRDARWVSAPEAMWRIF
ncbi:uncharacterized protein LOC122079122 isoform X1 [Macadamia integrifolia]|uniref:uncharacterized protein LOC122079122 isoform X1 n=1 Tax=Macadamia integrifolia TaxID=60698 RepID=UPI001C4E73A3|nr:uncharacterized protein LOC122079122 isoform X1 [Macadamia integrifolia]